jgi:hypothetical protein
LTDFGKASSPQMRRLCTENRRNLAKVAPRRSPTRDRLRLPQRHAKQNGDGPGAAPASD